MQLDDTSEADCSHDRAARLGPREVRFPVQSAAGIAEENERRKVQKLGYIFRRINRRLLGVR